MIETIIVVVAVLVGIAVLAYAAIAITAAVLAYRAHKKFADQFDKDFARGFSRPTRPSGWEGGA